MSKKLSYEQKNKLENNELIRNVRYLFGNLYEIEVFDDIMYDSYNEISQHLASELNYYIEDTKNRYIYIRV